MIKKTVLKFLLVLTVVLTLSSTSVFADTTGVVTASTLNVRKGPSTKYNKIGSLYKNKSIKILDESKGWYKINLNGKSGWVSNSYVKVKNNSTEVTTDQSNKKGVVTVSTLNVRKGPSTKYSRIGSLYKDKSITILGEQNGWYKINLNGRYGWVSKEYIKINGLSSSNNSSSSSNSNNSQGEVVRTMKVEATAYTGYTTTSTGQKPVWGTIAVDPKVIPYGTKVYIPQFGRTFIANNTGGAIKGNKIDIFMNTRNECYNWGRRTIEIQILK